MAELRPIAFRYHLENILNEYRTHHSIYGYSADFFFRADPEFDFSVQLNGKKAATPLGPAAGPHTQLVQNILLSWLHGSRIIELKTVQVLDDLEIPRPCIDMRNIGYNVEWSQEISLEESFNEYASAWTLIHLLPHLDIFDIPAKSPFYSTIFDMSIGYDLDGISSASVSRWLRGMNSAKDQIQNLLDSLPQNFAHLKTKHIPTQISDTITLSTFHGCPPAEIEEIVEYLICEHDLNVVVKMNPTLGGFAFTEDILKKQLGYTEIELEPAAFENDLDFKHAVAMMQRLNNFASKHKKILGAKFTNTLVVKNHESFFKKSERYLSGPPLYVLATQLAHKFRLAMGSDFPLSFSGGITKNNFSEAVAANLAPVTTCTDLLKKGGYKKLFYYMENLKKAMQDHQAKNLADYIRNFSGNKDISLAEAGQQNSKIIAAKALENPAYYQQKNRQVPKKIDSHLTRFDCLSCDICIPVCPNAANFSFHSGKVNRPLTNFGLKNGRLFNETVGRFELYKETQIGTIAEFCNHCGNCDTFCPEQGGPYLQKSLFFLHKETYLENSETDGFYFEGTHTMLARIDSQEYLLKWNPSDEKYIWKSVAWVAVFDGKSKLVQFESSHFIQLSSTEFEIARTVFEAIHAEPQKYPQSMLLAHPTVSRQSG